MNHIPQASTNQHPQPTIGKLHILQEFTRLYRIKASDIADANPQPSADWEVANCSICPFDATAVTEQGYQ